MIDRWLIARGARTYLRVALPQFGRVTIGSAPECDVRICEDGVASEHLLLVVDHGLGVQRPDGTRKELALGERLEVGSATLELGRGEEQSAERHDASSAPSLIMSDPAMALAGQQIDQAAALATAVLVIGETGTGKNLVAEAIHARSPRAKYALRTVAGSEVEALESIAKEAKGGTIVVDEIGGLDPRLQLAWRHLIERPPLDVRLIFLSNHELAQEVEAGSLRKDLYFWLKRFVIALPPLRARARDILPLAERFLARIGPTLELSDEARAQLTSYAWPGNVRELEHVLERAVLRADGDRIEAVDLPSGGRERVATNLRDELATYEKERILAALEASETQAEAAKTLGIPLRTLAYRMEVLGIRRRSK